MLTHRFRIVYVIEESKDTKRWVDNALMQSTPHYEVVQNIVAVMLLSSSTSTNEHIALSDRMVSEFVKPFFDNKKSKDIDATSTTQPKTTASSSIRGGTFPYVAMDNDEEKPTRRSTTTPVDNALFIRMHTDTFFVPARLVLLLNNIDMSSNSVWLSRCSGSNKQVYISTRHTLQDMSQRKDDEQEQEQEGEQTTFAPRPCTDVTWSTVFTHEQFSAMEGNAEKHNDDTGNGNHNDGNNDDIHSMEKEDSNSLKSSPLCEAWQQGGWDPLDELSTSSAKSILSPNKGSFLACATITPIVTRHDWLFTWNMIREGIDVVHSDDAAAVILSPASSLPCTVAMTLPSDPNQFDRRQDIRLTWGRQAKYYGFRVVFLVAVDDTTRWLQMALESEMLLHEDVLILQKGQSYVDRALDEFTSSVGQRTNDLGLDQCLYHAMIKIDTYVRPYQLLAMLDQIESGDTSKASVFSSLYFNDGKALESDSSSTTTDSDGNACNQNSGCNCDWATKDVCSHENANDGSTCYFACCCPFSPHGSKNIKNSKRMLNNVDRKQHGSMSDTDEVEDENDDEESVARRYTYIQGEAPASVSRLDVAHGIGRRSKRVNRLGSNTRPSSNGASDADHTEDGTKMKEAEEAEEVEEDQDGQDGQEHQEHQEHQHATTNQQEPHEKAKQEEKQHEDEQEQDYVSIDLFIGNHYFNQDQEKEEHLDMKDDEEEPEEDLQQNTEPQITYIMSTSLARRFSRCYQQTEHQSINSMTVLSECIQIIKGVTIVRAEPMNQYLPCNTRTTMTTNLVGQHNDRLKYIDWNLFSMHNAHVNGKYCSQLNSISIIISSQQDQPEQQEQQQEEPAHKKYYLTRRPNTMPNDDSGDGGGGGSSSSSSSSSNRRNAQKVTLIRHTTPVSIKKAKKTTTLTINMFDPVHNNRDLAPWETIDAAAGPTTYIFSVGVDATRFFGWAANNGHRDRGARQIKERWTNQNQCQSDDELGNVISTKCEIIVAKCVNCQGSWYSTIYGKLTDHKLIPNYATSVLLPGNDRIILGKNRPVQRKFDVGLPFACAWKRLSEFLKRFPYFNRKDDVNVRLILTNYPCPDGTSKTRKQLLNDISKKRSDVNVVVINVRGTFARARACNELHKRARPDSVLLVVDVDMEVQYPFFVHAEMYARAGISVYFPIVWSRFSPASIRLVEKFRGARVGRLSDYEGMWRPYGYGNYAIHGSDALLLQMDENIVGWGGEDNDFHKRCSALRHTVRMHDPAIVHKWHGKDCSVVGPERRKSCVGSLAGVEGSGKFLHCCGCHWMLGCFF